MNIIKKLLSILFITLLIFLTLDFFLGKKIENLIKITDEEKIYRIKNEFYHHSFLKNYSTEKARWGNKFYKFCSDHNGFKYDCKKNNETNFNYAFIGDSFTEGIGLEYEDTFVGMFENFTKQTVVNLGVSSYSPYLYKNKVIYLLENKIINFNHLIVAVDLSDLNDDRSFNEIYFSKKNLKKTKNSNYHKYNFLSNFIVKIKIILAKNFIITEYLARQIWWLGVRNFFNNYSEHYIAYDNINSSWSYRKKIEDEKDINFMVENMLQLSKYLKKNDIKFSLIIYPHPASILYDDKSSLYKKTWENFCFLHCDYFIDSFSNFFDIVKNKDEIIKEYYINGDVHLNRNGNFFLFKKLINNLN